MTGKPSFAPSRTPDEERLNTLTHGLGCGLAVVGTFFMFRVAPLNSLDMIVMGIIPFGVSLVLLYAVSTLSHAIHHPITKDHLRAWDQAIIYLFVAGTYSPLVVRFVPAPWHVVVWMGLWVIAGIGAYSKVGHRHRVDALATRTYILLGWGPATVLAPNVPWGCLNWVLAGGVGYMLGVAFLKNDHRHPWLHACWHLFVILGTTCHFIAIWRFALRTAA